jgi:hypothetical protein
MGVLNILMEVHTENLLNKEEKVLILKLNNPMECWKNRKTHEAAIINYLKANSSIPVPNVLSYSSDSATSLLGI